LREFAACLQEAEFPAIQRGDMPACRRSTMWRIRLKTTAKSSRLLRSVTATGSGVIIREAA